MDEKLANELLAAILELTKALQEDLADRRYERRSNLPGFGGGGGGYSPDKSE